MYHSSMGVFHIFKIVHMVPNRTKLPIFSTDIPVHFNTEKQWRKWEDWHKMSLLTSFILSKIWTSSFWDRCSLAFTKIIIIALPYCNTFNEKRLLQNNESMHYSFNLPWITLPTMAITSMVKTKYFSLHSISLIFN